MSTKILFIPLRENHERKLMDVGEEISLRRDFAPNEAWGEDTPTVRLRSFICILRCFCYDILRGLKSTVSLLRQR
jgi:hypothetical protein